MIYAFVSASTLAAVFFAWRLDWFSSANVLWQLPLSMLCIFVALIILFLLVLLVSTRFINRKHIYKKPDAFFRFLINETTKMIFTLGRVRVQTSGVEKIPKDSRYLLVSNHLFALDPLLFYYALPNEQFSFISKKENYALFLVSELMHATMCLPIDRENDRAALKTILKAVSYLKEDRTSIAVFPEGGTSKTGKLREFRNGVFKIAQKADVPIVVCTVHNTRSIPKNLFLKKTDVCFDVHAVISREQIRNVTTAELGAKVHEIMQAGIARRTK